MATTQRRSDRARVTAIEIRRKIGAEIRDAHVEVSAGHRLGGAAQFVDRLGDESPEEPGRGDAEGDAEAADGDGERGRVTRSLARHQHEEHEGLGLLEPALIKAGFSLHKRFREVRHEDVSAELLVVLGGIVVRAFRGIGWGWGGAWFGAKDYQHLSANGH